MVNDEKLFKKSLSHILKDQSHPQSPVNKPFKSSQLPQQKKPKTANNTTLCHTVPFVFDMKISTILTASTLFAAFASATPLASLDTRAFQVGVDFYGADQGTSFSQVFPANEGIVKISKFLKKKKSSTSPA